jgi:hypothetical protein
MTPSLGSSVRLSLAALRREAWLAALGLLVTLARRAVPLPALGAGGALLLRAGISAARAAGSPAAALDGVLAMAASPRFLGIVGGLWLAGAVASGALRAAWVAGALPVLAGAMGGAPRGSAAFVEGFARGFVRVVPAAVLGLVLRVSGLLFGAALVGGTLLVASRLQGSEGAAALAGAGALALTLAVAVPLGLATASDALVVRAALTRERLAESLAGVARRMASRPGAFLLGALLFGAAAAAVAIAIQAAGGLATGFTGNAPASLLLGPELMIAAAAALGAAVVDLAWLGTLAALGAGRAAPTGPGSAGRRASAPAA